MANDVSSPMPQMDLRDSTILTVSLDDAGARITRLVVHGWQVVPGAGNGPLPTPSPQYSMGEAT